MLPEIRRLHSSMQKLATQMDYLELELVDDPAWAEPSDTSWLNAADRANPDTMARVEANIEVNKLISWFGQDQEGYVGFWRGLEMRSIEESPILRLDSEGEYNIIATTIGDYLAISMDDDDFDDARIALTSAGFTVSHSQSAVWATLKELECPNRFRDQLENKGLKKNLLKPS